MSGYNFHGVKADGEGLTFGTDADYSVEFTTPKATLEDFGELYAKISKDIVASSKGAYTIEWLDDKHDTFVVKEGDKEVFTASQTSANFNTPVNNDILKAYLTVMHNKNLEVVVNSCPNLELAKALVKAAKEIGVEVKFKQEVIDALNKDHKHSFEIAKLPVYTPEPESASKKKESPGSH